MCLIILKLLPTDLTLKFSRKQDINGKWEIKSLMDFLHCEIESCERVFAIHKTDSRRSGPQNTAKFENSLNTAKLPSKSTTITENFKLNIVSAVELLRNQDDKSCIFCSHSDHKNQHCYSLNVNERKELLKRQGRCFVCLGKSHRIIDCINKKHALFAIKCMMLPYALKQIIPN